MTIRLSDVTLVVVDCVAHDLSRAAILDSLKQITPDEVLVWSDKNIYPNGQRFDCDLTTMKMVEEVLWYKVPERVRTSHWLLIQYDGWVLDSKRWDKAWLDLDYVGAPWWYKTLNVGNGGFSLRSTKLTQFVAKNAYSYNPRSPEDQALCRHYRARLERDGFTWASESSASRFAYEREWAPKTFGFHGIFNWHKVLEPDDFQLRIGLANQYVTSKIEWRELGLTV